MFSLFHILTASSVNLFRLNCANIDRANCVHILNKTKHLFYFSRLRYTTHHTSTNIRSPSFKHYLHSKISATGPISVAEFMRDALTHPVSGYYMHDDVIGPKGDFITSPELSQMFGELIAVWILNEWRAIGQPSKIRIVELGPGNGTLCSDILRTFKQLSKLIKECEIALHLVEVSEFLSKLQFQKLCSYTNEIQLKGECYMAGRSSIGVPLYWHKTIDCIPTDSCTFFIAHEFLDALPIHKFVNVQGKWKEIFVDIDKDCPEINFRFVLMPFPTPACKTLIQKNEVRSHVEVSPESALICQKIANIISNQTGAALLADYGHYGTKEDTLRAFEKHKQVDVLKNVGSCDVTADVDFKFIQNNLVKYEVDVSGPVTQRSFLQNMGIDTRLMMLLRSTNDEEVKRKLIGSYDMMTDINKMGGRFQFFAITSMSRYKSGEFAKVTGFI